MSPGLALRRLLLALLVAGAVTAGAVVVRCTFAYEISGGRRGASTL
jgi:hypothetical protein